MQAVNIYGVRELNDYYILNNDFLNKFNINIFCGTYNNNVGNNIIYGVKIGYDEIKSGIKKSNRMILSRLSKFVLKKFNKSFESPFVSVGFYNANIDKKEFKYDYAYDKYQDIKVKEYTISGNLFIKYCRFNKNAINEIKEIFKYNSLKYNYELMVFKVSNNAEKHGFYINILIKVIDNKAEEWYKKIKREDVMNILSF